MELRAKLINNLPIRNGRSLLNIPIGSMCIIYKQNKDFFYVRWIDDKFSFYNSDIHCSYYKERFCIVNNKRIWERI